MKREPGAEPECRLIALPREASVPDPLAALGFAREHGLEEGSSDALLGELRAGEEESGKATP